MLERDQFHDISEERSVAGPDGRVWEIRRGRTFFSMGPIASPPERRDEPDWVANATNDDGESATFWCATEAEATQLFQEFIRNIQTLGEPVSEPT